MIENMGPMPLPDGSVLDLFGSGGGRVVAESLSESFETHVPLLGSVPLDPTLRQAGDDGAPVVISAPDSSAGKALHEVAGRLSAQTRGIAGRSLPLTPC